MDFRSFINSRFGVNQSDDAESLKAFSTKSLVEELKKRTGVETTIAEPYENITVTANGPAIILKVID